MRPEDQLWRQAKEARSWWEKYDDRQAEKRVELEESPEVIELRKTEPKRRLIWRLLKFYVFSIATLFLADRWIQSVAPSEWHDVVSIILFVIGCGGTIIFVVILVEELRARRELIAKDKKT